MNNPIIEKLHSQIQDSLTINKDFDFSKYPHFK